MKFLLDENFPRSSADFIESCGHEAIRFDEACDSGDDDETVFSTAQRLGATILTSDRDFLSHDAAPPPHPRRGSCRRTSPAQPHSHKQPLEMVHGEYRRTADKSRFHSPGFLLSFTLTADGLYGYGDGVGGAGAFAGTAATAL